jgi:hypothetical protein
MSRAQGSHLLEAKAADRLALEGDQALRGDHAQKRKPERRLAGAAFADDAERFPAMHRDVDPVDGLDVADDGASAPP